MPSALLWASLAENIFIIAIEENLRIFLNCFFTEGELFAVTAQFPDKVQALRMRQKIPLSGELTNSKNLTERVHPTKRAAVQNTAALGKVL